MPYANSYVDPHPTAAPSGARCLADLAWLLQSQPLLSLAPQRFSATVQRFDTEQSRLIAAWLASVSPSQLQAYVAKVVPDQAPMRLGRYAERLINYFLCESGIFELVFANQQIFEALMQPKAEQRDHASASRDLCEIKKTNAANTKNIGGVGHAEGASSGLVGGARGRTIGEIDFQFRDNYGQLWQWELATKFYLYHAQNACVDRQASVEQFLGPAGKDTLALKLNKIFNHQLKQTSREPFSGIAQRAAYVRGWLFYPHGVNPNACDALNVRHPKGWWLNQTQFTDASFESVYFVHLPRLYWLSPYASDELPVLEHHAMSTHLAAYWHQLADNKNVSAQLLACVVRRNNIWCELSRGFVLP